MLRIGHHDAYDKWDILQRYWQDGAVVPDPGVNKFEQPCLPVWHDLACRSASRACLDYLRAKADGIDKGAADASAAAGSVHEEVARLLHGADYADLQDRVLAFAAGISRCNPAICGDGELPAELTRRLRDVFEAAAVQALRWTHEVGEIPTLEILREQTSNSFPTQAVRNCKRVLSIFCANFYGRSDVIHIHDAAPEHVTLVDLDLPSLEDMRLIYPAHWTYINQDYETFLHNAAADGLSFDLVVCDPYRGHGKTVAWQLLPTVMRLCSDVFITNYFGEMFEELAVGPEDVGRLSRAVRGHTGVNIEILNVIHRAADVYWVVMRMRR